MRFAAAAIWIVFIFNTLAMVFGWYERFPWYDIVMHAAGGVVIGFIIYAAIMRFTRVSFLHAFILTVLGTLFIGYCWEVFEWIVQHYTGAPLLPSIGDTLADLFLDMLGAAFAAGISLFALTHTHHER